MKKAILLFLRTEAIKSPKQTYFSIDPFLLKMYPNANPREIKHILTELSEEGLCGFSGNWTVLGATFGGVTQGLKEVTIHAHLTARGMTAADGLLSSREDATPKTFPQPLTPDEVEDKNAGLTRLYGPDPAKKLVEDLRSKTPPVGTNIPAPAEPDPAEPDPAEPDPAEPDPAEPVPPTTQELDEL